MKKYILKIKEALILKMVRNDLSGRFFYSIKDITGDDQDSNINADVVWIHRTISNVKVVIFLRRIVRESYGYNWELTTVRAA